MFEFMERSIPSSSFYIFLMSLLKQIHYLVSNQEYMIFNAKKCKSKENPKTTLRVQQVKSNLCVVPGFSLAL